MTQLSDQVDQITAGWGRIHPDADMGTLGVSLRLMRAGRILEAHLDGIASRHGFAVPGDYEVLAALRRSHPEPLRPTELAERLIITTSAMTGRLDRLEQAGLIQRSPHPGDRRATAIDITPLGIATADEVFADRVASETALLATLTNQQRRSLGKLLRAVLTDLGDRLPSGETAGG